MMAAFEILNIAQVAFALFDQIADKQATESLLNTNRRISIFVNHFLPSLQKFPINVTIFT